MSITTLTTASAYSNLSNALALAATGFRVFPYYPIVNGECGCNSQSCNSAGKHPRIAGYLDLAMTDAKQIETWWSKWPDAGIGICPDNQLILDVDGPMGHAMLIEFQKRMGENLPRTFTCVSGSAEPHHYHLYFRLPSGNRVLNKPLCRFKGLGQFTGIDVRSNRGQVAAPGTPHRSGGRYCWDHGELYHGLGNPQQVDDIPRAPDWLLSALQGLLASESSDHLSVQGKSKEIPSRGQEGMNLPPESNEWYLRVIRERWPIVREGQRNCLQVRPVTYLTAKSLPSNRIREIMNAWLNEFEEVFTSSIEQASKELEDCICRTQKDFVEGRIQSITDHSGNASKQTIHPSLERFFESNEVLVDLLNQEAKKHSNELSVSQLAARTEWSTGSRSLAFVLAVMLHYQYRVTQFRETDTILMTHLQLQEILEKRFQLKIHRKQLYQLADQFISRQDKHGNEKRASVLELLRQTKRGFTGKPSEYRVTGLPQLV